MLEHFLRNMREKLKKLTPETIYSSLLCGCLNKSLSCGGSVASAKAAKVSMIKFTHNI